MRAELNEKTRFGSVETTVLEEVLSNLPLSRELWNCSHDWLKV